MLSAPHLMLLSHHSMYYTVLLTCLLASLLAGYSLSSPCLYMFSHWCVIKPGNNDGVQEQMNQRHMSAT